MIEPKIEPRRIIIDIDGTICTDTLGDYLEAIPSYSRIAEINALYDKGHTIIFLTARGGTTGKDWYEFTEKQLIKWGAKYHKLYTNKIHSDVYIDDKGVHSDDFFKS